jgi:hypothetical protein
MDHIMSNVRQVICMKWGTLYGADYVNRLYGMVKQQTQGELRFVCLTDDTTGIHPGVECLECPTVDLDPPYNRLPWRKLALWAPSEQLHGLTGNWLFMDLDVVVTGGIDAFFEFQPEKMFVVMQNWTQEGQGIGNTSVFRFRVGCATHLQENLRARFEELFRKYRNEQIFISREIEEVVYWPDEWCLLFKVHCVPVWPLNFFKTPALPTSARVVAFPGSPNPHEAVIGEWPVTKPWKRLYKHTRPVGWIDRIWSEAAEALKS